MTQWQLPSLYRALDLTPSTARNIYTHKQTHTCTDYHETKVSRCQMWPFIAAFFICDVRLLLLASGMFSQGTDCTVVFSKCRAEEMRNFKENPSLTPAPLQCLRPTHQSILGYLVLFYFLSPDLRIHCFVFNHSFSD